MYEATTYFMKKDKLKKLNRLQFMRMDYKEKKTISSMNFIIILES